MSVRDRHENNIRRGGRVTDLRDSKKGTGDVIGTAGHGRSSTVFVRWDDGIEESVRSTDVRVAR